MITVAQAKKYLNITDVIQDAYLGDCINKAKSHIENYLNWHNLNDTRYTKYYSNIEGSVLALAMALTSVTTLQWLDGDMVGTDLIDGSIDGVPNSIVNTLLIDSPIIKLFKGFRFTGYFLKVVFNAGYKFQGLIGTVTTAIGSATVTGVNTLFTTELSAGDKIIVGNEKKIVDSITSATSLKTTDTFYSVNTAVAITLTTLPDIIREALEETTAYIFKNSWQGDGTLRESGKTISSGGGNVTLNFKDLDLSKIDKYKNII